MELGEDFFVLTCTYCGSTLRISMPDQPPAFLVKGRTVRHAVQFGIDRYLRERGEGLSGPGMVLKQVYYPYWKVDAILLKTRNRMERIEQVTEDGQAPSYEPERTIKRTEVSLTPYGVTFPAGSAMAGVPHTLGMRTAYLKGEPYVREELQAGYSPLPVVVNWQEAQEAVLKTVANVGRIDAADFGRNRTEMFRPHGSIVFFPYWVAECYGGEGFRRWVVDGVTGQVAGSATELDGGGYEEDEGMVFGELGIGLHRCGNCGHDLPSEQSYVYLCRHCGQVTATGEHALFDGVVRVTEVKGERGDVLLPFWSLEMRPEMGKKLRVLAGGLGCVERLVVPAFRMKNFEGAYRLARRMTTAVGNFAVREAGDEGGRFAPVGISPSEAVVLAQVVTARELLGQSSSLEVPGVGEAFTGMQLFFAPFHREHYFYVDSVVNAVAVEKNLVPGE